MTMKMQINGKGKFHITPTYADASALFLAEQERIGYRGPSDQSTFPRRAVLYVEGEPTAHISQNGKVWAGTVWHPNATAIYNPNEVA